PTHQTAPYLGLDFPPRSHSYAYPLFLCPFFSFHESVAFPLPPPLPILGGPDYVLSASPPPRCYQIHMASSQEKAVAVILMGGPTKGRSTPHPPPCPILLLLFSFFLRIQVLDSCFCRRRCSGTRFRPLSLNVPKPLVPLAGQPMVNHPISACKRVLRRSLNALSFLCIMARFMFVSAETANQFGELVADPITNEVLHYTERPETFVNDLINCGVYVFTPQIFTIIEGVILQGNNTGAAPLCIFSINTVT
ncbi:hypothetical protein GW17_00061629, partial [Ensete ventricosum]